MGTPEPDRRMTGWTGVSYDNVEVGRAFPVQPLAVYSDDVARFYRCLGQPLPPLWPTCRIPAFILNEFKVLKKLMQFPPGVLHAQEEVQTLSAAHLGEALTVEISISDKFIRNDKRFIVVQQHVQSANDQRSVAKIKHTLYWPC